MKILEIITLGDSIGGAQIHVLDLATELKKKKHEVIVITGTYGQLNERLDLLNINNKSLSYLKRSINIVNDIKAFKELKDIISLEKPDIVACHSSKAGIIVRLICYFLKLPNTFTVHGWSCANGVPIIQKKIYLYIEKILGLFSNKLITVAKSDADFAISHRIVNPKKITTIYNGVRDLSTISGIKPQKRDKFIMIMSARFQLQKDHSSLIKALIPLKELDWILYLLGDGNDTIDEVKKLVEANNLSDKVNFVGFVENVENYLILADLFLLISNWEGFPLTILEAMSMSLPIIASNVGGVKEQVIDNQNGFLIERNDTNNLTQKIKYLYENRDIAKEMGKQSREYYLQLFSLVEMVDKTENLYKSLIND